MTDFDEFEEPVTAPVRPTRQAKGDRSTQVLLIVGALVAVAGLAFAGGRFTASASSSTPNPGANNGRQGFTGAGRSFTPGQFRGAGGGLGGGVEGTVESVNGTTLTIKLANGNTATVDLAPTTTYHNETSATSGDVKAGSQILITIDTAALGQGTQGGTQGGTQPGAGAGGFQNRTFTAKDVIIVAP